MAKTNVQLDVSKELLRVLSHSKREELMPELKRLKEKLKISQDNARYLRAENVKLKKRVSTLERNAVDRDSLKGAVSTVAKEARDVINRIKALKSHKLSYHMTSKGWHEAAKLSAAKSRLLKAGKKL